MTSWWWVRHGPTHERAFVGWRDVPADLSDLAALARLSAALPEEAALVSSDLLRARATADALTAPGRTRLAHARALREFDFGAWDGETFDNVAARDPDLSRAFWERPGDIAPPGGESWNAVAARVSGFVASLNERHEHVIAVAHVGVIMTQLAVARGVDPQAAIAQRIDNLSLTRLDWSRAGWRVGAVNHLP